MAVLLAGCGSKTSKGSDGQTDSQSNGQAQETVEVKYATGFSVRDSAGVRLVNVGKKEHFALVPSDETAVPEGYTRVKVPVSRAIVMTMLQLSNFTALDAHDIVKGITGTKNLFNADILQRVKDGRIVKIGMEGNFDTEMVLAANPDVIFISPSKRGGYDAIKETGIQLIPHLGYQELDPLGQAEWVKFVGLFIGKVHEANELFGGIEERYNALKAKAAVATEHPTVFSGEMHYGTWHAVGGKNYLAQIFRDAGAKYVIDDEETGGENLEFERMYALAANADYWRILNSFPGDFSYEALKASEPRNELFKAFKERKVIYCNMKQQAYYEQSPVEPDVLLKDLVAVFHPELVEPDYKPKYLILLVAILVLTVVNLLIGSVKIPLEDVCRILTGDDSNEIWTNIIFSSRLPQALTAIMAGAGLAVSGLQMQTVFRNPLAGPSVLGISPSVLGISNGSALGVAFVVLLSGRIGGVALSRLGYLGDAAMSVAAIVGALGVLILIVWISNRVKGNVTLLIIGVMIGYLANAIIGVLKFLSPEEDVKAFVVWGLGSFSRVSGDEMVLFVVLMTVLLPLTMLLVKTMNLLLLGDRYAANLGLNIRRSRLLVILSSGVLVAIVTAYCGPIMFIGLAVPHLARALFRSSDHRVLMPATALCGAALALFCNLIARMPGFEGVLPVNSVTALVGAPVIAAVLFRKRNNEFGE